MVGNFKFIHEAQISNSFVLLMVLKSSKDPISRTEISQKYPLKPNERYSENPERKKTR